MLYTLNLYNVTHQIHLNKAGGKINLWLANWGATDDSVLEAFKTTESSQSSNLIQIQSKILFLLLNTCVVILWKIKQSFISNFDKYMICIPKRGPALPLKAMTQGPGCWWEEREGQQCRRACSYRNQTVPWEAEGPQGPGICKGALPGHWRKMLEAAGLNDVQGLERPSHQRGVTSLRNTALEWHNQGPQQKLPGPARGQVSGVGGEAR